MIRFLKIFLNRIVKDFQHKELIPLKFIFFLHASTVLVLYPYLTIHMRELGINVRETAIMSAVTPLVAIVMPPLAGMLADKIGNFRLLLAFFSTLVAPVALLLLAIPVGRLTVKFPETTIMDLSCTTNNGTIYLNTLERNYSCIPAHPFQYDIDVQIKTCGLSCDINDSNSDDRFVINEANILATRKIEINKYDDQTQTTIVIYPDVEIHNEISIDESTVNRQLRNNELYDETIRMIGNSTIFFPVNNYVFTCNSLKSNSTIMKCNLNDNSTRSTLKNRFRANILPSEERTNFEQMNMIRQFSVLAFSERGIRTKYTPVCEDTEKSMIVVRTANNTRIQLDNCEPRCLVTTPRKMLCDNLKMIKERNVYLTFWTYLCVRVVVGMISGTAFAMFEGAVIAVLREHKADYGLQRVYASIGGMISSPLSGWLIDWASQGKDYTDFRPAFYLYAFLKVATGCLILLVRLDFKKPAQNIIGDVKIVLKNPEMIALLISCFILGTAWGYIESFLFWLLQDLGGSRSLMGITITVGGIFGIPLLVMSGPIIDKIGHANVVFIGFVFYAIRLLGYSLIYNAWYCLIFEAMESVTTGLAFTAAVTYAAKLSTTTTDTSIQGLLGGLYFGVGKGAGSLIGGFLISAIGTRPTYQIFSVVTALTGVIYVLFNHFYLRKHATEGNEICKKEKKKSITDVDLNNLTIIENKKNVQNTINENKNNGITRVNSNKENNIERGTPNDNLGYVKDEQLDDDSLTRTNQKNGMTNLAYQSDQNLDKTSK